MSSVIVQHTDGSFDYHEVVPSDVISIADRGNVVKASFSLEGVEKVWLGELEAGAPVVADWADLDAELAKVKQQLADAQQQITENEAAKAAEASGGSSVKLAPEPLAGTTASNVTITKTSSIA